MSLERVSALEEELTAANQEVRAAMFKIFNFVIYLNLLSALFVVLYPQW